MKKILLLILLFSFVKGLFAQNTQTKYHVETFMTTQSFYLNGGARAMAGGRSRVMIPINLPPNTVDWYYALTTTPNNQQNPTIQLASQLGKLLDPGTGIATSLISNLTTPNGTGICDVFLSTDINEANQYTNKQIQQIHVIQEGTRENFKSGVVNIRQSQGQNFYIVLRNPSAMTGTMVTIEVAAIVGEKQSLVLTDDQQKAQLYSELGTKALQASQFDKCIEYSRKALSLDASLPGAQSRLALAYLITGQSDAMDEYVKAIENIKHSSKAKEYFTISLKDIDIAMQRNTQLKDATLIRSLLAEEVKRYNDK